MYYPETGTLDFGYQIYHKKEFNQYKIPEQKGNSKNLDELMVNKCSMGVKTSDTQKLLKNFLSPHTPYRSLLVYHGVGVGKTCASIMIAENYRQELEKKNKKYLLYCRRVFKKTIRDKLLISVKYLLAKVKFKNNVPEIHI